MSLYRYIPILLIFLIAACSAPAATPPASTPTLVPASAVPAPTDAPTASPTNTAQPDLPTDLFSAAGIQLDPPACEGSLTPPQAQGPFYTPDTPVRNSLLEPGIPGQRMIVVGYVLDGNCQPIPNAWLDFWQTDGEGNYDNVSFKLRGQQFADDQGRYFLETVYPGEYPGRTPHIHVKVGRGPENNVLTTQIYFPDAASNRTDGIFNADNLVILETREDALVAFFNFVLP